MLRTFLIRHANLTTMGPGLTLIGSRFDADSGRILEVLSRNRLPSRRASSGASITVRRTSISRWT
jgi:hypothetical protein